MLAAATAINLKRLLDHGNAAQNGQIGSPAVRYLAIRVLTRRLIDFLNEIGRLTTTDLSTGS